MNSTKFNKKTYEVSQKFHTFRLHNLGIYVILYSELRTNLLYHFSYLIKKSNRGNVVLLLLFVVVVTA